MKKFLLFFLLLFLSINAFAVIKESHLEVLAVTSDGQGLGADMFLTTEPGKGNIWVAAEPLVGTTTQSAARTARDVAKKFAPNVDKYDYKFLIDSQASLVEGPSAGAAMTLLIISSLQDKKLPENVSITGTIDSFGNVGPVGGVFEKAKEATNLGIDLFMIPRGEAVQTVRIDGQVQSINLLEYGPNNLGMTIVEVSNIDDVMKFAFSDIKSIDVSKIISEGAIPDFVPKPIVLDKNLSPMKKLVTDYITETNQIIEEAKTSVSTAAINDSSIVNTLLETITGSEQTMKQAEILNEQNYLYSAANFAFLARVNAMIVRDVSKVPSLLNLNSTALEPRLSELKRDISQLEERLDKSIPLDYLEWHISAQQRLVYAKINAQKLSETQVVPIGEESLPAAFERITDFEFAVAWLDVAHDFYDLTSNSQKRIRPTQDFSSAMDELIAKGEQQTALLPEETADDIARRIDASKLEKSRGWYVASVFDAATGFALSSAENLTQGKEVTELSSILESKINDVEKKLLGSKYEFVWPELYLAHAKYFLESSKYYSESGQTARAVNSLRSGISLIMLADQLFLAAEPMQAFFEKVPSTQIITVDNDAFNFPSLNNSLPDFGLLSNPVLLTGFLLVLALFVLMSGFFVVQVLSGSKHRDTKEFRRLKELQRKADDALLSGKISEEKHSELSSNYLTELALIEKKHSQNVSDLIELDREKAEVVALEKRLSYLEAHYNSGLITQSEFKEEKKELDSTKEKTSQQLFETKKRLEPELKKEKQIKEKNNKPIAKQKTKTTQKKTLKKKIDLSNPKRPFKKNKKTKE